MNFLANTLNISREHGNAQPFSGIGSKSGKTIDFDNAGNPILTIPEITKQEDSTTIIAGSEKQLKEVLNGLKRKYKSIDIDNSLKNAKHTSEYIPERVNLKLSWGGDLAFRSVCKTAVNFYIYKNGQKKYIEDIIAYIMGNRINEFIFFMYQNQNIIPKCDNEVLHSIIVKGDNSQKILYAYIEFFNCFKCLIVLNTNYSGENIVISYFYDVINSQEVFKSYNFTLSRNEALSLIKPNNNYMIMLHKEFTKIMNIIYDKKRLEQLNKIIDDSLQNDTITEADVNILIKNLQPYIVNFINTDD